MNLLNKLKHNPKLYYPWLVIGAPFGWWLTLRFGAIRVTSRVRVDADSRIPAGGKGCIYVNWHRHIPFLVQFYGALPARPYFLISTAPYMEAIRIWLELSGLRIIRGASSEKNADTVGQLKGVLLQGESVCIAVDGPAGPGFKIKKGCLDLARQTGRPIVPTSYVCKRGSTNQKRWDQMYQPTLFDRVDINLGEPIYVDAKMTIEEATKKVEDALNALNILKLKQ